MVQPINYLSQIPQPDLSRSLLSGLQLGTGIREIQQQRVAAEQAQAAKQQLAADVEAARADGSQQAWLGMIAKYPQFREAFSEVRKGVGEEQVKNDFFGGFEVSNALEANQPLVAAEKLKTIIAAKKNSGQPAGLYEQALSTIEVGDSKRAQSGINEILSALDPERFEKTVKAKTAASEAPLKLRQELAAADKAEAEARVKMETATDDIAKAKATREFEQAKALKEQVNAKYAEQVEIAGLNKSNWDIQNLRSQIGDRSARLNLDTQKTAADVAEKMSSIQKNLSDIPADTRKLINESATLAATSKQSADQFNDLAKRIESEGGNYGVASSASDFMKKIGGFQGGMTQLKQEYTRLRNTAAIKSLPPGPATDKDIQMALSGFPSDTANARDLAVFLRGMAKLQDIDASVSNAKTDWLAQNNGTLTRAKNTFVAGDYATKPGETFNDFAQRVVGDVSKRYATTPQSQQEQSIAARAAQIPTKTESVQPQSDIRSRADAILRGGR